MRASARLDSPTSSGETTCIGRVCYAAPGKVKPTCLPFPLEQQVDCGLAAGRHENPALYAGVFERALECPDVMRIDEIVHLFEPHDRALRAAFDHRDEARPRVQRVGFRHGIDDV